MTNIYFRDLPRLFHLDHSGTIRAAAEGHPLSVADGRIRVMIGGTAATEWKSLSAVDLEVVRLGDELYVHRLESGSERVRLKVVDDCTFGFEQGPILTLADDILLRKKADEDSSRAHCTRHRLDFGRRLPIGRGSTGIGCMRWRFGSPDDYILYANDHHAGFVFRASPLTGDLELWLGEYKLMDDAGNRKPISLRSGPYSLYLDPGFDLYFRFDGTDQPVQFLWPSAVAAMIKLTERSLRWLHRSKYSDHIFLRQVSVGPDVISATRFAGSEIGIRIGRYGGSIPELSGSHLYGSAERFSWHTQWPTDSTRFDEPSNRLLYEDPNALNHNPGDPDFREEFYRGVWVGNLFDQNGGPARFDASLALLSKPANSRTLTLEAGGHVQGLATILAPKFATGDTEAVRSLHIPVERTAFLSVGAEDRPVDSPVEFVFSLDYRNPKPKGEIRLRRTFLKTAPFDASAVAAGAFDHWTLAPPHDQVCKLDYGATGARIPLDFAENWTTVGKTEFVLSGGGNGRIAVATSDGQSALETDENSGIRYARVAARLEFGRGDHRAQEMEADEVAIAKFEIDPAADRKWLVRNEGIGDLVYLCQEGMNGAPDEARRLVDKIAGPDGKEVFLKLGKGLKAALKLPKLHGDPDPAVRYWDELGRRARPAARPGLAMDFSGEASAEPWALLGWSEADWKRFRSADPQLWPAYERRVPIGLDPSQGAWRGHLLRDFLIAFPAKVKEGVRKYPALLKLYEQFERSLLLDYGWHDARGWSFRAGYVGTMPVEFFRWADFVRLSLVDIQIALAANRIARGHGRLRIELPFLQEKRDGVVEDYSLDLGLTLADLGEGIQVQSIFLEREGEQLAIFRDPIPGVEGLCVKQIKTDLKTLALVGQIKLTEAANTALGIEGPVDVELAVPLDGAGGAILEGRLPGERSGRVAGWGAVIRGLRLALDGATGRSLEIVGSINLAVDGFVSVGFIARFDSGVASFRITDYVGKLAVGGFALRLNLGLDEKNGAKFFHGTADLLSSLTGQIGMQLKIGEKNGDSYWIGAIRKSDGNSPLDFGNFGALNQRTLVLGRRVERGNSQGALEKALLDPSGEKVYHATERNDDDMSWLDQWVYAEHIDFVIGASGFLGLDDIFMRPGGRRTGIMLTSGGYFRIEAHSNFFGKAVDYDLTLDTANEFIYAGFHAPRFNTHGFQVSGGYVGLGLGYGRNSEFALTVGWPFPTFDPQDGEPDWSRAVTVKWDAAFPLNTFAGGVMVHIGRDFTRLGMALRGGWTKNYQAQAWNLEAKAELGIMLGGVLYFELRKQGLSLGPPSLFADRLLRPSIRALAEGSRRPDLHLASALSGMIDGAFGEILSADPEIRVGLYADIWGEARVEFMGITLVGVRIDAHARVNIKYYKQNDYAGQIYYAGAHARFSVEVKIGCTTYRQSASFNTVFVDRPPPSRFDGNGNHLPIMLGRVGLLPRPEVEELA